MDLRKLKDRALELTARRKFDKAAEVYAEICALEPKDLQLRQRWGDSLRAAGKGPEAVAIYRAVADSYAHDGQLLKAIAVNKLLLEIEPRHTATQLRLAELYARRDPSHGGSGDGTPSKAAPAGGRIGGEEFTARPAPTAAASPPPALRPPPESGRAPRSAPSAAPAPTPLESLETPPAPEDSLEETTAPDLELELGTAEDFGPPANEVAQRQERHQEPQGLAPAQGNQPPLADVAEPLAAPPSGPTRGLTAGITEGLTGGLTGALDRRGIQARLGSAEAEVNPPPDETFAKVPDSPLFESLDPAAFVELLQRCQRRPFKAGDQLIAQGDPAHSFFVLSEGELKVVQRPSGEQDGLADLARLHPGDFFGELALVSDSPRIASVEAITDGLALEFPGAALRDLVDRHPAAEAALHRFARARLLQNAMSTSPLFRPFDKSQRRHLIARFVIREVGPHQPVLVEGMPSDGLYVVMQGRFRVERGRQRLATLGVGEVFGEISLLTRANAGASVVSESRSKVLRLPRQAFEELILTHPQVLEMVSQLADEREKLNDGVQSGKLRCDTEGLILM